MLQRFTSLSTRSVRCLLPAVLMLVPVAAQAADPVPIAKIEAEVADRAKGELRAFYATNDDRPLWIESNGSLGLAAKSLLGLVQTAQYDGLDPAALGADELAEAMQRAESSPSVAALAKAELALSRTFAAYVAGLRQSGDAEMIYEHDILRPYALPERAVLEEAAKARSLAEYVSQMRWMHPLYAPLRQALTSAGSDSGRDVAMSNLERIRAIPAEPASRHVIVDTASARLWMYEGDRPVDSMKVVVGKPELQTPTMAGYIRYAIVNPYWNVPQDLVRKTIATNVLNNGVGYLKSRGYQVLANWSDDAELLDPRKVDWRAVKNGELEVRVRQLPGGANAMGKVKYEFPNPLGIYLHDTPDKNLMLEATRQFSSGCVRLEDAERLGRWLLGGPVPASDEPERQVNLRQPVPVYITYLTAHAEGDQIALGPDPYGRDRAAGAALALQDR